MAGTADTKDNPAADSGRQPRPPNRSHLLPTAPTRARWKDPTGSGTKASDGNKRRMDLDEKCISAFHRYIERTRIFLLLLSISFFPYRFQWPLVCFFCLFICFKETKNDNAIGKTNRTETTRGGRVLPEMRNSLQEREGQRWERGTSGQFEIRSWISLLAENATKLWVSSLGVLSLRFPFLNTSV